MKTIFFDANIIADWLLIAPKIINIKDEREKELALKNLWKEYTAPKICFEVLELLRSKKIEGFIFLTSDLALSEVGDVIFKESRSINLTKKGIAYRYIPKMIKKIVTSEGEVDNIMEQFMLFRTTFLNRNGSKTKIKIHNRLRDPILPALLISLFRIETYDAYLISQAYDAKCDFFVTKDKDLRKEVKFEGISLISPEKLLEEIKKENPNYISNRK